MDPIASFSGLSSGIQWQDMIDQIMKLEAARKVAPLSNKVGTQTARIDAWKAYEGLVSKLKSASLALRDGSSFGIYSANVGTTAAGRGLISATAATSTSQGSYQIGVTQLARAEKISGRSEASTTTALGLSGQFLVNGRAVELTSTDTLNSVRDKINAVNSGNGASAVTATILTTGPNAHRLILTADHTGSRGIELVDSANGGGVLQDLGILDGSLTQNSSPTGGSGVDTHRFASSTAKLATMLGVSPMPTQTSIRINGQKIVVDLANDTLIDIMNRINPAESGDPGSGVATLLPETVGGQTHYRLSVEGDVELDTDPEVDAATSQRVVELLGFQRSGRSGEIATGADAVVSIDGFAVTRRTNVVSDAIAGVSINLLAADPGETVDLSIRRNTSATADAIQAYADAFNAIKDFVDKQRTSGDVLATNGTLRTTARSLTEVMLADVASLTGTEFSRTSNAGVALDRDGKLRVDTAALNAAIARAPNDVKTLFGEVGSAMYWATDSIAASYSGTAASQIRFLEDSNAALAVRIDDAEKRLEVRRQSMIAQYTRMETMLSQIQSQGSWLSQQIKSLQPSDR